MQEIRKVLVPTDFSDNAATAYNHAQEIANRFGAKVDLIHIIPTLQYFRESMARIEAPLDDIDHELYPTAQKETKRMMERAMEDFLSEENRGKAIVQINRKPSTTIAEVAKANGYDLIVMASKGSHESELLRGSTTEKVIRHSEVPVFTVDAELSRDGLHNLLLPVDGSEISFTALPLALTIADIYGAEITLFHVQELYGSPLENTVHDPRNTDEVNLYESLIDQLENYLIEEGFEDIQIGRGEVDFEDQFIITEGASSHRINFHTVIEKGVSAHLGIEEYAKEHSDLVVMATHGHSGLAHFLLGSTTEKVSQSLALPVVTVKPDNNRLTQK
jgi:nucleotide-binding universal stress UspA family protein